MINLWISVSCFGCNAVVKYIKNSYHKNHPFDDLGSRMTLAMRKLCANYAHNNRWAPRLACQKMGGQGWGQRYKWWLNHSKTNRNITTQVFARTFTRTLSETEIQLLPMRKLKIYTPKFHLARSCCKYTTGKVFFFCYLCALAAKPNDFGPRIFRRPMAARENTYLLMGLIPYARLQTQVLIWSNLELSWAI